MMSPASFTITREQAAELAEEFARNASADTADLEDMQRLSVEAILEAQNTGTYRVFPTMGPGWRELMFGGILPPVEPEPATAELWEKLWLIEGPGQCSIF